METKIQKKPVWLSVIRWTARIITVLFTIILFFMFISEDMSPIRRFAQLYEKDYFILSLWILTPIGYLIGLWREGLGGLIGLISILTHIVFIPREQHNNSIYLYLFLGLLLIPSILYLLYWHFNKKIIAEANSITDQP
jgi:hypothetical protein